MTFPTGVLINRRSSERMPLRCPVEVLNQRHGNIRGMLINLSSGGAMMALPCELTLGVELQIVLHLPDGLPALELTAISLRAEKGPNGAPPVKLGVNFILPPAEAVQRIRSLIYGG
jgi:hypothetical protein